MTHVTSAPATFDQRVREAHLAPLWERMSSLITHEPGSACRPAHWDWLQVRSCLLEAGAAISAAEAERRVLILENPGLTGSSRLTTSLYGGVQLLNPGEDAPVHRHSQSALRFVMEGSGAHTVVDGERAVMQRGDVLVTPPGSWHDHGNHTAEPMIWFDALDIPTVAFFDASFLENGGDAEQPVSAPSGASSTLRASGVRPRSAHIQRHASPVVSYPYAAARAALDILRETTPIDPWNGYEIEYVNPDTGGSILATMSAGLRLLPKGTTTVSRRSTDGTVLVVHAGRGRSSIGDTTFAWGPGDVVVVPSWVPVTHHADEESVHFLYSDRAAQERLGLWREQRDGS